MTFSSLGLEAPLLQSLDDAFAFEEPLNCQKTAIPPILEGRDVLLQAMTGSGKTMAYLLPLWQRLVKDKDEDSSILIIAPSQELAMQLVRTARALEATYPIKLGIAPLVGAGNIRHQVESLKDKPRILIGTPGRVMDLFEQRKINGQLIRAWVLDEADALWQEDEGRHLSALQKKLLRDVQKIAISASYSSGARSWFEANWPQAKSIISEESVILNPNIRHFIIRTTPREKFDQVRRLLAATDSSQSLIFLNRPEDVDLLVERLQYHSYPALALHAQMKDTERQDALRQMVRGEISILVATDVMARGMDLPGIDQVLQLDFPLSPLSYVHRAGRTGRAGRPGSSVSFVIGENEAAIRIYERDLGIMFEEIHLAEGQVLLGSAPKAPKQASKKKGKRPKTRKPRNKSKKRNS